MIQNGEWSRVGGQFRGLGGHGEVVVLAVGFEDPELKGEKEKRNKGLMNKREREERERERER